MKIKDGEVLLMVGGPRDGQHYPVNFIFPFLDGGLPPNGISFGDVFYMLNQEKRQWEYTEEVKKK